jgi:hypothetical protein
MWPQLFDRPLISDFLGAMCSAPHEHVSRQYESHERRQKNANSTAVNCPNFRPAKLSRRIVTRFD